MNEIDKRVPAHEMMLADLRIFIPNYLELSAKHGQGWIGQKSMSDWLSLIQNKLHDLDRIKLPFPVLPDITKELMGHLDRDNMDETLRALLSATRESLAEYGIELTPTTDS
ncbi:hypothetical protein KJ910_04460 [Patescibacteria group bacterium]|nr:hypothetical protein [Patescibacteria group bacterium]MBU1906780.1 hypothetical protein [Patescibacteria group bacterium]